MNIGDRVKYIDEVGGGVIQKINGEQFVIVDEDGFTHDAHRSELILDSGNLLNIREVIVKDSNDGKANFSKRHNKNHKSKMAVDLHIHELVDHDRFLTNSEMIEIQLKEAKEAILKAKKNKVRYVVLIHGKGKGKLRSEIHKMLKNLDVVDYYDLDISIEYSGATEVQVY